MIRHSFFLILFICLSAPLSSQAFFGFINPDTGEIVVQAGGVSQKCTILPVTEEHPGICGAYVKLTNDITKCMDNSSSEEEETKCRDAAYEEALKAVELYRLNGAVETVDEVNSGEENLDTTCWNCATDYQ